MEIVREKFSHPIKTAKGETRAWVSPEVIKTLWFNTGTICNLTCQNCYIESSPTNDKLAFIEMADVKPFLEEIATLGWEKPEIGFTGGEPFANPKMLDILELRMENGYECLVLTNATQPMWRLREKLLVLKEKYPSLLKIRVSLDHYTQTVHEEERGAKSWDWAMKGLSWLAENNFTISIAGRSLSEEESAEYIAGYGKLFTNLNLSLNPKDKGDLVVFAEMDENKEVPEITTSCWDILKIEPKSIMCASSRMVVKDKGAKEPRVAACTLLPYEPEFSLGHTLKKSWRDVRLNHQYCAQFCVLGGSSCSQ